MGIRTVLVTGATGTVGRRVVDGLVATRSTVRATSRTPDASGLPAGVTVTTPSAPPAELFAGVDAALVNPTALGVGTDADAAAARLDTLLSAAGDARIVLLSTASALDDASPLGVRYRPLERLVRDVAGHLIVRPTPFALNTAHWWGTTIRAERAAAAPYPDVETVPIDERDVADVLVRLLTDDAAPAQDLLLTGPQRITPRQQVATIADRLGIDITFTPIPPDTVRQARQAAGAPEWATDGLLRSFEHAHDYPLAPTDTVARITGHPPRDYRQWVTDHVAAFR
jgi:uncharacterized protein YbjT (DUF2867 family)